MGDTFPPPRAAGVWFVLWDGRVGHGDWNPLPWGGCAVHLIVQPSSLMNRKGAGDSSSGPAEGGVSGDCRSPSAACTGERNLRGQGGCPPEKNTSLVPGAKFCSLLQVSCRWDSLLGLCDHPFKHSIDLYAVLPIPGAMPITCQRP